MWVWFQNNCNRIDRDLASNLWSLGATCVLVTTGPDNPPPCKPPAGCGYPLLTQLNSHGILLTPKRRQAQTGANTVPPRRSVRFHCVRLLGTSPKHCGAQLMPSNETFWQKINEKKKKHIPGQDRKKSDEDYESFKINRSPDKELCDVLKTKINWTRCLFIPPPPSPSKGKSLLPRDPQSTASPSGRRAAAALPIGKVQTGMWGWKGQNCPTQLQFHLCLSLSKWTKRLCKLRWGDNRQTSKGRRTATSTRPVTEDPNVVDWLGVFTWRDALTTAKAILHLQSVSILITKPFTFEFCFEQIDTIDTQKWLPHWKTSILWITQSCAILYMYFSCQAITHGDRQIPYKGLE